MITRSFSRINPSSLTRRQKAQAGRSEELDVMSNYKNMDIMLSENNSNSLKRELESGINVSVGHGDSETIPTLW